MAEKLVEVKNLKKYFKTPKGLLHAVDDVSFSIEKGKTLGVVGESGCGKSTLGRVLIHLEESTAGNIEFDRKDITVLKKRELKKFREDAQMIFQDPYSSLNPRYTIEDIIMEPLLLSRKYSRNEARQKTTELMNFVGIAQRLRLSYPHELDGGRRQRVGIARALALNPDFIVLDEPVSALDVSIQAQVLNLMEELQQRFGLTYLFISHDLSVVKHISDQIAVMYLGQIVETASSKELFARPLHPYTQALLSAVPIPSIDYQQERIVLEGDVPSPINPGKGCRFAGRCRYCQEKCRQEAPVLKDQGNGHMAACHFIGK